MTEENKTSKPVVEDAVVEAPVEEVAEVVEQKVITKPEPEKSVPTLYCWIQHCSKQVCRLLGYTAWRKTSNSRRSCGGFCLNGSIEGSTISNYN